MGKVTESLQVNEDYRSLIKDCVKLDAGVKEVKGKELEELRKKKEEYRTYTLARTFQSAKAFRDEALRVEELGKKASKKDRDSLNAKQQVFLKELEELIRADDAVGEAIRYGESLGEIDTDGEGKKTLRKNEKYYNVKDTNRTDLIDNTDIYKQAGALAAQNVHLSVNGAILFGDSVKAAAGSIREKKYNPTYWKLKDNSLMKPGTYGSAVTAATINSLGSLLGLCYGVYSLVTDWNNMHGLDRTAAAAGILQSAGAAGNTVLTAVETVKDLADSPGAAALTKAVGISVAGLKAGTDLYTALSGHFDCRNSDKASKLLKDRINKRYIEHLKLEGETKEQSARRARLETGEQKDRREKEFRKARFDRNMLKLSQKISDRKRNYAGVQTVASFMTVTGLTVPVIGTLVSGAGAVLGAVTGILSGMKLTRMREAMFDAYFQFDEFIKNALKDMEARGQRVNDLDMFKLRMRRVLAASAGCADVPSACDQIARKYSDQIIRGLFGDDEDRVEGERRKAYIELVKSFGLPYDEKKKIPGSELLARRMNGK
ncbi:MAG: hypothetical protein K5770_08855 [Lachnospiraceae bacterium]|nr:hypothetical protein [Lachnospiraceae bacterium]